MFLSGILRYSGYCKVGELIKLRALLKICLFAWNIGMFWFIIWMTNSKHHGRLGILVKIYIFSRDDIAFLCGICLIPEKMTLFSILNKQLCIVARYLEVHCRITEYPAKCTSFGFIYCTRTPENIPLLSLVK